jgi:hypothetical protein
MILQRFALEPVAGNDYIPGLYIKSSWNPPRINDGNTELAMMAFANRIEALVDATQQRRRSNLTPNNTVLYEPLQRIDDS